jgi:hypothetical protein
MNDTPELKRLRNLEGRIHALLEESEARVTQSAAHGTAAALDYARGQRQGLRLAMRELLETEFRASCAIGVHAGDGMRLLAAYRDTERPASAA